MISKYTLREPSVWKSPDNTWEVSMFIDEVFPATTLTTAVLGWIVHSEASSQVIIAELQKARRKKQTLHEAILRLQAMGYDPDRAITSDVEWEVFDGC